MKRRIVSVLCALALCLSLLPTAAWAAGGADHIVINEVDENGEISIDPPTVSHFGETAADTYQITATVYDIQNMPMENPDITWELSETYNDSVTVNPETGVITVTNEAGYLGGDTTLTATCGNAKAEVTISIVTISSSQAFGRIAKDGQTINGDSLFIPDDGTTTTANYVVEVYNHYGLQGSLTTGNVTWSVAGADGETVAGVTVTPGAQGAVTVSVDSSAQSGWVTLTASVAAYGNTADYPLTLSLIKNSGTSVSISGLDGPKTYGDGPFQLTASVSGQDGTGGTWTWENSDPEVLSVESSDETAEVTILNAGTANISVNYENNGISGFAFVTVTVSPIDLSGADIQVYRYTAYTGTWQSWQFDVYLDGKKLENPDYSRFVSDAISVEDAGEYTVTVSSTDSNYTGTASTTFTIPPRDITNARIVLIGNMYSRPYTGLSQTVSLNFLEVDITDEWGAPSTLTPEAYTIGNVSGDLSGTGAGTYTITLTATDSNFTGTATREWYITPAVLTITGATLDAKTYDGDTAATVTGVTLEGLVNGESLVLGTDYTATAEFTDANAGDNKTAIVTVTLKDEGTARNYAFADGSKTATFTLTDQTIGKGTYTGPKTASGSARFGAAGIVDLSGLIAAGGSASVGTVTDSGSILEGTPTVNGGKLSFAFADNADNANKTAAITISVTGADNYTDYEITVTVTVNDKPLDTSAMKVSLEGWTYGDAPNSPTISGVDGYNVIYRYTGTGSTSYGPSDTPPTDAGTYRVTATYETDDTLYTAAADFSVLPKSVADAEITLGGSLTYTGSEQTVTVGKVIVGGRELTASDYTVGGTVKATDAGSYTLIVTGTGNYADTVEKTWNIARATLTAEGTGTAEGTFGDTLSQLNVSGLKAVIGENIEVSGTWALTGDTVPNAGDPGTYTIVFTPAGGADNFANTLTAEVSLNIHKAGAQTLPDKAVTHKIGTGDEQTVNLAGLMPVNAGVLTYATGAETGDTGIISSWRVEADGTVKYTLSDAGTAGQSVTLPVTISSTNYEDSTVQVVITLTDKEIPNVSVQDITRVYDGSPIPASEIKGTANVDGVWSWKEGQTLTEVKDSGTKTVIFAPTDSGYMSVEVPIQVTIQKATPTGTPQYTAITASDKTLADAGLTTEGGTFSTSGTVAWELTDTTTVQANTNYKWFFTPTDSENYNHISGSITLYVVSSGGGGSSSSSGNKTETTKNPDGSTTTTVTGSNGTVTETTKFPDGSKEVIETKKDGTVTTTTTDTVGNKTQVVENTDGSSKTTVNNKDGSGSVTVVDENGQVVSEATLSKTAVAAAQEAGEAVTLPMPEVPVTTDRESAPTVTVDLPSGATAKVEIPVENVTPSTVAILVKADGTEEVIKTTVATENGVAVTLEDGATVKIVDNSRDFADVPGNYWGAEAIDFAVSRELFAGTSATTFSPDTAMTRAMIVTVLARFEGVDTTTGSTWYEAGQQWAMENGVSDGSNMDASLTREQLATMLYRYAQAKGYDTTQGGMAIREYADFEQISGYAVEAMTWAVNTGIINGTSSTTLSPQGPATRAQVATILMRFIEMI